jgi:c-di-GMP phosphodiesterase
MKKNIFFVFTGMLLTIFVATYFYNYTDTLNKESESFTSALDALKNDNLQLDYDILAISLYAYGNQDRIANDVKALQKQYKLLHTKAILNKKGYKQFIGSVEHLGKLVSQQSDNITNFLILNANIKNSFVFLLGYTVKSNIYFPDNDSLHRQIEMTIEKFLNAQWTQDPTFLADLQLKIPNKTLTQQQQNYVTTFNKHAEYINNHFEALTHSVDTILHNPLNDQIDKLHQSFGKVFDEDKKTLYFTTIFILFSTIIGSTTTILLYIRIEKENKALKRTKKELDYKIIHDNLTDLFNRRALERMLKEDKDYTLLLINIDKFKHINDFYGNDAGNLILKDFAGTIKIFPYQSQIPTIFRIGGDEFALLFESIDTQNVKQIAKSLNEAISTHEFFIQDVTITLTVSIAISNTRPLLENADMALKHIKADNKKNLILFDSSLDLLGKVKKNIETMQLVNNAIKHERIVAFFQPILNLQTGKIEKYESLVRIIQEDGTILPPMAFLPVIENTFLYYEVTKIMISKTLQIAQEYRQYRFSLNLLMQDITNEKLMDMLFQRLKEHKDTELNIDIELLETQNLYNMSAVNNFISKAHTCGCHVFVDDFGTGYSNFSYFSELDIDILKIDASITKHILENAKTMKIMQIINQFASNLGIKTVAEFVDNEQVLKKLSQIGINYAQGYLIGKPSPSLLKNNTVDFLNVTK